MEHILQPMPTLDECRCHQAASPKFNLERRMSHNLQSLEFHPSGRISSIWPSIHLVINPSGHQSINLTTLQRSDTVLLIRISIQEKNSRKQIVVRV